MDGIPDYSEMLLTQKSLKQVHGKKYLISQTNGINIRILTVVTSYIQYSNTGIKTFGNKFLWLLYR